MVETAGAADWVTHSWAAVALPAARGASGGQRQARHERTRKRQRRDALLMSWAEQPWRISASVTVLPESDDATLSMALLIWAETDAASASSGLVELPRLYVKMSAKRGGRQARARGGERARASEEGRRTLDGGRERRREDANELLEDRVGRRLERVVRAAGLGVARERRRVAAGLDGVRVARADLLERRDAVAAERRNDALDRRADLGNEGRLGGGEERREERRDRVEDGLEDLVGEDADELRGSSTLVSILELK